MLCLEELTTGTVISTLRGCTAFFLVGRAFLCTGLFPDRKKLTANTNRPCDLQSGTTTTDRWWQYRQINVEKCESGLIYNGNVLLRDTELIRKYIQSQSVNMNYCIYMWFFWICVLFYGMLIWKQMTELTSSPFKGVRVNNLSSQSCLLIVTCSTSDLSEAQPRMGKVDRLNFMHISGNALQLQLSKRISWSPHSQVVYDESLTQEKKMNCKNKSLNLLVCLKGLSSQSMLILPPEVHFTRAQLLLNTLYSDVWSVNALVMVHSHMLWKCEHPL